MTGGVGRMPSSQAAYGRNSPTVMNSTTLLGTLPSEVIIIFTMIFVMIRDANLPPPKIALKESKLCPFLIPDKTKNKTF